MDLRIASAVAIAALPLLLGGCATVAAKAANAVDIDWDKLTLREFLGVDEEEQAYEPAPVYCYATLGREECHAAPVVGEATRLRGYVGPVPAAGR